MPIFEYKCDECGTKFEKLVRGAADRAELVCPSCGKPQVTRQLSTFAAHSGSAAGKSGSSPMCPGGGVCPTPGACGLN